MRYESDLMTGEVIELSDDVTSHVETQSQIVARYEAALDAHMDSVARQHRYDNRFTFALRAGFNGPYQAEGAAFAQWLDACNHQAFSLLGRVLAGEVSMPESVEAFIATLPEFNIK